MKGSPSQNVIANLASSSQSNRRTTSILRVISARQWRLGQAVMNASVVPESRGSDPGEEAVLNLPQGMKRGIVSGGVSETGTRPSPRPPRSGSGILPAQPHPSRTDVRHPTMLAFPVDRPLGPANLTQIQRNEDFIMSTSDTDGHRRSHPRSRLSPLCIRFATIQYYFLAPRGRAISARETGRSGTSATASGQPGIGSLGRPSPRHMDAVNRWRSKRDAGHRRDYARRSDL